MKKSIVIFCVTLFAIASIMLIYLGTINSVDPYWNSLDTLLARDDIYYLDEKPEIVDSAYRSYHIDEKYSDIDAVELISNPFLATQDVEKFIALTDYFYKNKKIIVSGVSGAGKTTIIDRAAKFLATSPERIEYVQCIERMDIELHKEWIGIRNEKGFYPGKLLKFFEKCWAEPEHNFVFIIDDIDKVYPATFFGAAIWNELDEPKYDNSIDGYSDDLKIPPNFYMISATHSGAGSTIKLNFEHFRRLGNSVPYMINPDPSELLLYIRTKFKNNKIPEENLAHIKKVLFFFTKANEYITKNYGKSYQMGQWTAVRKYIKPENFDEFVNVFITAVNTHAPDVPLTKKDFEPILYSIEKDGLIKNSNTLYIIFENIVETGIFSEITVAILFAFITALISYLIYRKKRKFIKNLISKAVKIVADYKTNKLSYDEARGQILVMKENLHQYILKNKINFVEANYLTTTLEQQLNKINDINKLSQVSIDLKNMFDKFTEDGILDKKEYDQLITFLDSIKSTLPAKAYYNLKNQIDDAFRKSSALI